MDEYSKLQTEISAALSSRQQLEAQLQENEQELKLLKDDAQVFKLVGPVMLKQDLEESRENVTKRIDFIKNEVKRLDQKCNDLIKKQENLSKAIRQNA